MRSMKTEVMEQLLMELRFAPAAKKTKQAEAAERLLAMVKKETEYPYEFVCFQITGYRPKGKAAKDVTISGSELIDDLQVFIRKLSGKVAQEAAGQGEKVYNMEEAAEHFGVSARTIERWRKLGLGGRQFVFGDGKKRTGFTESNLSSFASANETLVSRARSFTVLTEEQRRQVVATATEMAAHGEMDRKEVIAEIAKKFGTSAETIRYHIVKYEQAHPGEQIFGKPAGVVTPQQMHEVIKRHSEGASVEELMRNLHRSRSSIYRIINAGKAREFIGVHMEYVDSSDFIAKDAELTILGPELPAGVKGDNTLSNKLEAGELELHDYFQALKDVPPLSAETEKQLFRRYNYLKCRFNIARFKARPGQTTGAQVKEMQALLTEARAIGLFLRQSFLRVVVTVSRKHHIPPEELRSYIVFGNKALTRALETYDFKSASRFSNFASLTIAKDFALAAAKGKKPSEQKQEPWERGVLAVDTTSLIEMERSQSDIVNIIRQNLDDREQRIIMARYDVEGAVIKKHPKSLNELGAELGMIGEEVRRLELAALGKLRHVLPEDEFARLTDERP
jgi:DNA-directed RNA polymerase sigma subunit (sigma70/sigma32)/transposase